MTKILGLKSNIFSTYGLVLLSKTVDVTTVHQPNGPSFFLMETYLISQYMTVLNNSIVNIKVSAMNFVKVDQKQPRFKKTSMV